MKRVLKVRTKASQLFYADGNRRYRVIEIEVPAEDFRRGELVSVTVERLPRPLASRSGKKARRK
jgi:hypothetical protein